jgi:hypothetical protein
MTAPVPKRADQLVVGDRILPHRLPSTYALGPGEVVYVKPHVYRGNSSVFVAYVHKDGYYDSTSYLPDGTVEVLPADTGLAHSRVDDGEDPQPSAGRVPPHYGAVEVAGDLVEIPATPAGPEMCGWCPDPYNPDPTRHPGGTFEHIPLSAD